MDIVRIAGISKSTAAAGAIAGMVRDHGRAEVRAIGDGAVNQAMKAIAIARHYLSLDVICLPDFVELMIEGQERTALRISVELR